MSDIDRDPVSGSTNIKSIGYDENNKTLAVEFKNGSLYHYHDVPKEDYNNLIGAKSVGGHLNANIKGVYKHSKQ